MTPYQIAGLACKEYYDAFCTTLQERFYWELKDDLGQRQHLVRIDIPFIYILEECNNDFDMLMKYVEDLIVRELFEGVKNGISFEELTGLKWHLPWEENKPIKHNPKRKHKN